MYTSFVAFRRTIFIKCRLKLNKVINWKTKNKHKFNFRESKEVSFSEPPKMEEEEREHQEVQKKSRYLFILLNRKSNYS